MSIVNRPGDFELHPETLLAADDPLVTTPDVFESVGTRIGSGGASSCIGVEVG